MNNYWVSNYNPFVSWYLVFPKGIVKNEPSILFDFTEAFLALCVKYEIFQLEQIASRSNVWQASQSESYAEYLRNVYKKTNEIPFFNYHLTSETKTCFGTDDGLSEKPITNLRLLLEELRPNISEVYKSPQCPVTANGPTVIPSRIDVGNKWESDPYLCIMLYSDIWLPFVFDDGTLLKSNEAIASCHTPRFNRWLGETKSLGASYGATWEYAVQGPTLYKEMLNEDGINLDYKPSSTDLY